MTRSILVQVGAIPPVGGGSVFLDEKLNLTDAVTSTLSASPPAGWPTASTTGTTGTLTSASVDLSANGAIYTNLNITNGGNPLYIDGNNMTFVNCRFPDSNVIFANSDGTTVTDCDFGTTGMSVSSSSNITFTRIKIVNYSSDGIHVTSDGGSMCTNVVIKDSYIFNSNPAAGAHSDGIQVRGSSALILRHNYFDQGPTFSDLKNAAVFIEDANGGNTGFLLDNNYFKGGGYYTAYLNTGSGTVNNNTFVLPNGYALGGMFYGGGVGPGISGSGNVDGNGNPLTI